MSLARIEKITGALLYEGYLLYPYRRSSVKNRQRWTLGGLYPQAFGGEPGAADAWSMQTECLLRGHERSTFEVRVRFLHLIQRTDSAAPGPWQEATERDVAAPSLRVGDLLGQPREIAFVFPWHREVSGTVMRQQEAIEGGITISAVRAGEGIFRVTIGVRNITFVELVGSDRERRDAATLRSLASAHTLISVSGGELVSLLEPPDALREAAAGCRNVGTWPVLVGEPGARDTMLSSPIILYDYPRVAPESSGDLFDATEIEEILTLRILTLTDDEKQEMRAVDERTRALLARIESLGEADLQRLHGAVRTLERVPPVPSPASTLAPGVRVRLRPSGRADIFDIALAGKEATVASIEQDFEDRIFVTVTVDEDPGRDLGAEGKPGHRFFFRPEEVEIL
jgi:hypothetical protein